MQLPIIVFTYLILATIFNVDYRYNLSPDTISYIRLAEYIADGNFHRSVVMAWSPLFPWLMSLFLLLGLDGLTAANIVVVLSGLLFLIVSWKLSLRFELSGIFRFIAMLTLAVLVADFSVRYAGPNLLMAALIAGYFYLITDPYILKKNRNAFIAGMVAGTAYLAKQYAFWFALIHLPLSLILRAYMERGKGNVSFMKKNLRPIISGMTGLLLIALLWIGIVSLKHNRIIISPSGKIAYSVMGPDDVDRRPSPFYGGLQKPNNNYSIHIYENPSELKYKSWSPFESKDYLLHQINLILLNSGYIIDHFVRKSFFFLYPSVVGMLMLIPIALALTPLNNERKFIYVWTAITYIIFCSGLILTYARSPKYLYVLMMIFLIINFHFIEKLINAIHDRLSARKLKYLTIFLLVIVVSAFTFKPGVHLSKSIKNIITKEQVNPYSNIARQILEVDFPEPYAVVRASQKPHTDYYIAYYLKKQFLGRPLSSEIDEITKEIKEVEGKSILVFDNEQLVVNFKKDGRYIHLGSIKLKDDTRYSNLANIDSDVTGKLHKWDKEVNVFEFR